ncbi:DUF3189 family protein [Proteinivorax hydrogeniformans]|uniref:DUF3189 family protein n=1 Tax=Proteinivorax hydrogeniformans TaxID=1826727 RepID=A0AAU8HWU8_9FIRM
MKIIYNCYGGSHSSVLSGYIHCGIIEKDKVPSAKKLLSLAYYDSQKADDHGIVQYIGTDSKGNRVYSVGLESEAVFSRKCVKNIAAIMGISCEEYVFVDTMPAVNWFMRIGGFLSRALGLKAVGRPLVIFGTQRAFFDIINLVEDNINKIEESDKK